MTYPSSSNNKDLLGSTKQCVCRGPRATAQISMRPQLLRRLSLKIESSFCSFVSAGIVRLLTLSCLWADDSFMSYLSLLFLLSCCFLPYLSWERFLSASTSPGDCERVASDSELTPCQQPHLSRPGQALLPEQSSRYLGFRMAAGLILLCLSPLLYSLLPRNP